VNPAGTRAYITNDYIDSLVVIDTATNQQLAEIDIPAPGYPTGCDPRVVIVSDDNTRVYVACETGNRVYQIDAASHAIIGEIGVGFPPGWRFLPQGLSCMSAASSTTPCAWSI
jgi:YVTN family beta-propeller protein